MSTWNDAPYPELAPPALPGRLIGGIRVGLMFAITAICLGVFLVGRGLRGLLGRWVTFHFFAARLWARACLWLCGVQLTIEGRPIAAGALVANHSSWLDILALRAVRLIYFVSKDDVASWPGVGFIARITGTVFIKRKRTEAKRQEAVLRERIAHDQVLCIFPEGTSTDGLRVVPFKSSLFSAFFTDGVGPDIEVQPVSLRYTPAPGTDLPENFYGWWGTMSFEGHIWDVVTRSFGGHVHVRFAEPLRVADFPDRKTLADHCGRIVAAPFGGVDVR